MDFLNCLSPLERIEEGLGELYERFATRFADDPDAAFLFKRLYLDEKSHAATLDAEKRLVRKDSAAFDGAAMDCQEIEALTERVADFTTHVVPDLATAVLGALELECAAARLHRGNAARHADSAVAKLFDYLARCDDRHAEDLREFARSRDILPARPDR